MYDRKSNFKYKYTIRAVGGSENPGGKGASINVVGIIFPLAKKIFFFKNKLPLLCSSLHTIYAVLNRITIIVCKKQLIFCRTVGSSEYIGGQVVMWWA